MPVSGAEGVSAVLPPVIGAPADLDQSQQQTFIEAPATESNDESVLGAEPE
jgi:hypothetical protein